MLKTIDLFLKTKQKSIRKRRYRYRKHTDRRRRRKKNSKIMSYNNLKKICLKLVVIAPMHSGSMVAKN